MKKVIFGAGRKGRKALSKYGEDNIEYFIDNNDAIVGTSINGVEIHDIDFYQGDIDRPHIIIACAQSNSIVQQLETLGITNYEIYGEKAYFDTNKLIYNPYEIEYKQKDEDKIEALNREVANANRNLRLFNHIEIETINRCNGVCNFCPVSVGNDSREYKIMQEDLFYKIVDELERINYDGKIALFSNNEPFLDERIIIFHRYAREHLPHARFHLCTNGTILTVEMFKEVIKYLDELIIDNYNQQLKINSPVKKIVEYCEHYPALKEKVTVVLRKTNEVLTSRGGDAPNTKQIEKYPHASCLLPFKQMIVRPSGKVSLCCNDALGKITLGDLNKESVTDVWYGKAFSCIREKLLNGRGHLDRCRYCDTIFFC